jgi:hypothetical protein
MRQSRDDCLQKMAIRIQARATRRCGELLAQVPTARGARTDIQRKGGTSPTLTRASVANEAGLSDDQRKTALRMAAVPAADFEEQVESEEPPTVTKLAQQGKKTRPLVELEGIDPADFAAATEAQGALNRFADYCRCHDPVRIAGAFKPQERKGLRDAIATVDVWFDRFIVSLPE